MRAVRGTALAVVWLGGLVVGFFGVLSVAARYGCAHSSDGLACRKSGSALGIAIVLAVVAIVTAATVTTHDRAARITLLTSALAVTALAGCYLAAHSLLATA